MMTAVLWVAEAVVLMAVVEVVRMVGVVAAPSVVVEVEYCWPCV
jgi:hypothetical protein